MNFGGDHPRIAMARYRPDAFSSCRPWQEIIPMRSRAAGHGRIVPWCSQAAEGGRIVPDASSRRGLEREKHRSVATSPPCIQIQLILERYVCYVSKRPRKAPAGEYTARTSCRQGRFFSPSEAPNHARRTNLAVPSSWSAPTQGPPSSSCIADRLSTAWSCPGRLPQRSAGMPVTRQRPGPSFAVPVAARETSC